MYKLRAMVDMAELHLETVIPPHSSILLVGPPGSGKTELAISLAKKWITQGERTLFVTISASGEDLIERLQPDAEKEDIESVLRIIDCYVPQSNASDSRIIVNTNGIAHLESISLAISTVVDSLGTPVRIIVDGMSSLFLYNAPQTMSKFVQVLSTKTKLEYGSIMFVIVDGMHESLTMNTMMSLVDGVVDIREDESLRRCVRIRYLKGTKVDPRWFDYLLESGEAVLIEAQDIPSGCFGSEAGANQIASGDRKGGFN